MTRPSSSATPATQPSASSRWRRRYRPGRPAPRRGRVSPRRGRCETSIPLMGPAAMMPVRPRCARRATPTPGGSRACGQESPPAGENQSPPCRLRCAGPMAPTVWLIIPTYNEASNLERIVRASLVELERCVPGDHRVLVVDDNSPDGTGAIGDALAKGARHGRGPAPPRQGRPRSGLRGRFRPRAAGGRAAGGRDGRGLLPRPALPPGADQPARSADVVLGSRYVAGGGVRDWGLVRRRSAAAAGSTRGRPRVQCAT